MKLAGYGTTASEETICPESVLQTDLLGCLGCLGGSSALKTKVREQMSPVRAKRHRFRGKA